VAVLCEGVRAARIQSNGALIVLNDQRLVRVQIRVERNEIEGLGVIRDVSEDEEQIAESPDVRTVPVPLPEIVVREMVGLNGLNRECGALVEAAREIVDPYRVGAVRALADLSPCDPLPTEYEENADERQEADSGGPQLGLSPWVHEVPSFSLCSVPARSAGKRRSRNRLNFGIAHVSVSHRA